MTALWYPCTAPERPTDPYVRWHYRDCLGCTVAATALEMREPDAPGLPALKRLMGFGEQEG